MNKKYIYLILLLVLFGFVIAYYLASSGKDFYSLDLSDSSVNGAVVYQANCVECHGTQGEGVASFPQIQATKLSRSELQDIIKHGQGEMPGFNKLSDSELSDLIEYVVDL